MVGQKHTLPDADAGTGEALNGTAAEGNLSQYYLVMADRRVEEGARKVAEQIRVVSEINASGASAERATELLRELQQELSVLTERRETVRLELLHDRPPADEIKQAG
jgi:uncharacterized coiled-coil protein SlyX